MIRAQHTWWHAQPNPIAEKATHASLGACGECNVRTPPRHMHWDLPKESTRSCDTPCCPSNPQKLPCQHTVVQRAAGMTASTEKACSTLPHGITCRTCRKKSNLIVQQAAPCGDGPTCNMRASDTNRRLVDGDGRGLSFFGQTVMEREHKLSSHRAASQSQRWHCNKLAKDGAGHMCKRKLPMMTDSQAKSPATKQEQDAKWTHKDDCQATWSPARNRSLKQGTPLPRCGTPQHHTTPNLLVHKTSCPTNCRGLPQTDRANSASHARHN